MKRILCLFCVFVTIGSFAIAQETDIAVDELLDLSLEGNVDAQFKLACHYDSIQEYDQAFEWFQKAAIQGDVDAQYKVGYYYWYRIPDAEMKNKKKAFDWWRLAAEKKQVGAMFYLGCCYFWGGDRSYINKVVKIDDEEIFGDMYHSIFNIYILPAMFSFSERPDVYEVIDNHCNKAIDLWKEAANQGFSVPQYFLSMMHFRGGSSGDSSIISDEQALEWLISAAEKGDLFALYELGCYYSSKGEIGKAIVYLTKVANEDSHRNFNYMRPAYYAQKKLIKLYKDNNGRKKYWIKRNQDMKELIEAMEAIGFKF